MVDTIKISKVLGDPIRHKILLMLVSQSKQTHSCCSVPTGGICNCQIMADFGMIRSRVSYHMKELLDAGLVGEFPKGKWRYYFLNVDVIISNCVINLSGNKDKVFHETFRVLKPGGRFAVADIVLRKKLPEKIQQDMLAWAGCVAGALLDKEYRDYLAAAGFTDIDIEIIREYVLSDEKMVNLLENLSSAETKQLNGAIVSAFVRAKKP